MAREASPSIIFMDEIDSIGSARMESGQGGDSEVQRTMLELLNQLDGFEPVQNIKVCGAFFFFNPREISKSEEKLTIFLIFNTSCLHVGNHGYQPHRHPRRCPSSTWPN